jgi:hypothetical protein|nr:MAG TPA_asm: hypothetical protein [Caudoviricetes sp.]
MFIAKQNGTLIIAASVDKQEVIDKTISCLNTTIEETDVEYVLANGHYVTREEAEKLEQEKINHLTCTALDLATFIKQAGLTDAEVLQFLNTNPSLQLQLTLCKDVYCGVVRQLCPLKITEILTLTDDMVVGFFKKKHNIK